MELKISKAGHGNFLLSLTQGDKVVKRHIAINNLSDEDLISIRKDMHQEMKEKLAVNRIERNVLRKLESLRFNEFDD